MLIGVAGMWCASAYGQERAPDVRERHHTFVLVGVPLLEALNTLMEHTTISMFFESALVADQQAFCNIQSASEEDALRCILQDSGLDFYRLSSGTYVLYRPAYRPPPAWVLSGQVVDAETGEPLRDAHVVLLGKGGGTATNAVGRFAFAGLAPGVYHVGVSHVAYHDAVDSVKIEANGHLRLALQRETVLAAPIVVNGLTRRLVAADLGRVRQPDKAERATAFPAAASGLPQLGTIMGVQLGDALAEVHVQGGDAGEHQYLLDRAPIFVPIRNGGLIGPFSPLAIERITVHKAGYPAVYGGHLSGVIALEHDVVPALGRRIAVHVDPLSANVRLNGQMRHGETVHTQWMVAGQMGLWRVFKPPAFRQQLEKWSAANRFLQDEFLGSSGAEAPFSVGAIRMGFWDLHATVRTQWANGLRSLSASQYRGFNAFGGDQLYDAIDGEIGDEYEWFNTATQVRYTWVQGSRTFMEAGLWSSAYRLDHPFEIPPFGLRDSDSTFALLEGVDFNKINQHGVRLRMDHAVARQHTLAVEVGGTHTNSDYFLSLDPRDRHSLITPETFDAVAWTWYAFMQDGVAFHSRTHLEVGTRFTFIPAQKRLFVEPRLALRHDIPEGPGGSWAVRGAVGLYRQYLKQYDIAPYNATALLPSFRFWLPVRVEDRPSTAYHLAGDVLFMPTDHWQLRLEAYYKHQPMLHMLNYGDRAALADLVIRARGMAYGMGFGIHYNSPLLQAGVQYEFAQAQRRIPNRYGNTWQPVPWEQPHAVQVEADVLGGAGFMLTVRGNLYWGRTSGFRQSYYDYLAPHPATQQYAGYDLTQPGQHRLPPFVQWDAGMAYHLQQGAWGLQARLMVLNVLGRRNVLDWSLEPTEDGLTRRSRTGLPFLPLVALSVTR